jgi:hypothetical protein
MDLIRTLQRRYKLYKQNNQYEQIQQTTYSSAASIDHRSQPHQQIFTPQQEIILCSHIRNSIETHTQLFTKSIIKQTAILFYQHLHAQSTSLRTHKFDASNGSTYKDSKQQMDSHHTNTN